MIYDSFISLLHAERAALVPRRHDDNDNDNDNDNDRDVALLNYGENVCFLLAGDFVCSADLGREFPDPRRVRTSRICVLSTPFRTSEVSLGSKIRGGGALGDRIKLPLQSFERFWMGHCSLSDRAVSGVPIPSSRLDLKVCDGQV